MGFDGPIAINQLAVHENMDLYGVDDKRTCLEKVMFLSDYWINRIKENNES